MTRTFRVLKSLGGCGGTIVSRALAANGALVLSEVNPRSANLFAGALNPLAQMNRNHFALLPERLRSIDVHTLGLPSIFGRLMADLADALAPPLVIRAYSYVDYIGLPFIWPRPERACLRDALDPYGATRTVLLVRHPADCLSSLLRHAPLATVLDSEIFVAGHLAFLADNRGGVLLKFEDFLADPANFVAILCAALDLPCDAGWQSRLGDAPALTGNPLAVAAQDIVAMPRRRDDIDTRLMAVEDYDRLLAECGYAG